MYLLVDRSNWLDRQKSILLVCAFFVGIRFEAYRFDDYHALADSFYLYTVLLLLRLENVLSFRIQAIVIGTLGLFSGLSVALRLNDGLTLSGFSALAIVCIARSRRWSSLLLFSIIAALTVVVCVSLTGDSLVTWATFSILHVAAIKGGGAQFASDPIRIFSSAYAYIVTIGKATILELLAVALSWTLLITSFNRKQLRASLAKLGFGLFVTAYSLYFLFPAIKDGTVVVATHAILTWIALIGSLLVVVRASNLFGIETFGRWHPRELLFFIPVIMLASGSLSSAGSFSDLYIASGFMILLFPIVWHYPKADWLRSTTLVVLVLTAISGAWFRFNDPASWISYSTSRLFSDRRIVTNPSFGPMVIDNRLYQFITPICSVMDDGDSDRQLLTIPWAYANYFCNIAPWHGFVQTWFDTSSKPYIDDLIAQLRTSPPKWILYQRQLGTLANHEILYNQGQPLPQRALDDYIVAKINDGEWRVVRREDYGIDSDWILLRTRWDVSHGPNLLKNPTARQGLLGWHVQSETPVWSRNIAQAGFTVSYNGAAEAVSSLSHDVTFPKDGRVWLQGRIGTSNVISGHNGYTIDLYDPSSDTVISSLGWSNLYQSPRDLYFSASVIRLHKYQIRLQYHGVGDVTFSDVSFSYETPAAGTAHLAHVNDSTHTTIGSSTFAGWTPSQIPPLWSSENRNGGSFVVTHETTDTTASTLYQRIHFHRTGAITVQVIIGAHYLDAAGGYGYVVDLYDDTANAIVGSLGVPATVSSPQSYSFVAGINNSDSYALRLRFNAARGRVTFSRLKIEEGTKPTSWSDEATMIQHGRRR